jgi:hypothetical protein
VLVGLVVIAFGAFIIGVSPWMAEEARKSKLADTFFIRLVWNFTTNVWYLRYVGAGFIAVGVIGLVAES